jgi:hypothetical protein
MTMTVSTSPRQALSGGDWLHRINCLGGSHLVKNVLRAMSLSLQTGGRGSLCRVRAASLTVKTCAFSLSLVLFIGAAAAQTPDVNSRQPQQTQQQFESNWNRWNNRVAPELDRLNAEIMRAAARQRY